jgi:hypothetical protein
MNVFQTSKHGKKDEGYSRSCNFNQSELASYVTLAHFGGVDVQFHYLASNSHGLGFFIFPSKMKTSYAKSYCVFVPHCKID